MPVGQPPEDEDVTTSAAAPDRGDPELLAEHRARRAESEDEHLLARLNRAEQDRVLLATRLAEAEGDLDRVRREGEGLRIDLAARDRELAQTRRRIEELTRELIAARADVEAARSEALADVGRRDVLLAELVAAIDVVRRRTDELLTRLVPEREALQEDLRRRVAFESAIRAALDGLRSGEPAAPSAPEEEPGPAEAPTETVPVAPVAPVAPVVRRPLPDLAALLPVRPDPETTSLIGDLERAAERLRARVAAEAGLEAEEVAPVTAPAEEEEPVAVEEPVVPDEPVIAEAPVPDEEPVLARLPEEDQDALVAALGVTVPAPVVPEPSVVEPEPMEPEPEPEPMEPEPEPAAAEPEPEVVVVPAPEPTPAPVVLLPRGIAPATTGDWLPDRLAALAERDPARAAQGLLAILPAQVRRSSRDLTFDLEIEDAGIWQVSRWGPVVAVDPRTAAQVEEPDFTLSGTAAALVPILAGRSRRLRRRVRVGGHRRRLRRLLKDLGSPVALAELAEGALPDPGLVLELLAGAVRPTVVEGHEFLVSYLVEGPAGAAWSVHADGHRLQVRPHDPYVDVTATVTVPDRAFVALLAGLPLPDGTVATVAGSAATVQLLHEWFAAVQEAGA